MHGYLQLSFYRKKLNRVLYVLSTVIFFFLYNLSLAQRKEIDSLQTALLPLHGTERINCLNELSKYYCNYLTKFRYYARTDSAEQCANEAYTEAVALNYKLGIADAVLNLGEIYTSRYDFFTAHKYVEKAISLFKEIKDEPQLNRAYMNLIDILFFECDIVSIRNKIELPFKYYKSVKDTSNESRLLGSLSACDMWQGHNEKAFEYLQKEFNLIKNLSDPASVLTTLYSKQELYRIAEWLDSVASYSAKIIAYKKQIGLDTGGIDDRAFKYFVESKYDSSEYYYKQEYNYINSHKGIDSFIKNRMILRNNIDLASVYQCQNKYKEALPIFMKALQVAKEKNIVIEELEVLLNISQVYELEGNDNEEINYVQNLLSLAQKTEASNYIEHAYELLCKIYNKKKDSSAAYNYYVKYTTLKDSGITRNYQRKLAVINELTNEREQQEQISALDKDNKLKKDAIQKNILFRNILLAGLFILILLGFITYRVISLKRKNEKLEKIRLQYSLDMEHIENEKRQSEWQSKATELEMQALRAQMNPHFIFNCLSSINRFILKNETEAASNYLTKFSRLIRTVLINSKRPFISLEDELEMLCLYLDMEKLRFKDSFDYSIIFTNSIDAGNVFVPPMLLQPFAENAIWHGLMHKEGKGYLEIELNIDKKILTCVVTDNGIGRSKAAQLKSKTAEKQKSMGLKITIERLAFLNKDQDKKTFFNIEDVTDKEGNAAGTRVILKMNYRDLTEVTSDM